MVHLVSFWSMLSHQLLNLPDEPTSWMGDQGGAASASGALRNQDTSSKSVAKCRRDIIWCKLPKVHKQTLQALSKNMALNLMRYLKLYIFASLWQEFFATVKIMHFHNKSLMSLALNSCGSLRFPGLGFSNAYSEWESLHFEDKKSKSPALDAVVLHRFLGLWFSIGMWPEHIMVCL